MQQCQLTNSSCKVCEDAAKCLDRSTVPSWLSHMVPHFVATLRRPSPLLAVGIAATERCHAQLCTLPLVVCKKRSCKQGKALCRCTLCTAVLLQLGCLANSIHHEWHRVLRPLHHQCLQHLRQHLVHLGAGEIRHVCCLCACVLRSSAASVHACHSAACQIIMENAWHCVAFAHATQEQPLSVLCGYVCLLWQHILQVLQAARFHNCKRVQEHKSDTADR